MTRGLRYFALLPCLLACAAGGDIVPSRAAPVIPLHGVWRAGPTDATVPPPIAIPSDWTEVATPGAFGDGSNTWFWLVRDVDLGTQETSRAALLRLESACFLCEVWLNGRRCGKAVGGYAPIEMDVTAAVRPGTNRLALRLGSWSTVATNRYPAPDSLSMSHANHRVGLWQRAEIQLRPSVYVADLTITPTVDAMRLRVDATVVNTQATAHRGQLHAVVHEQVATSDAFELGAAVFALPPTAFDVPGGTQCVIRIEAEWAEARLWWPHDPHLYALRAELRPEPLEARIANDTAILRFGFREVSIRGTDLRLNGRKLVLRGQSMTRYGSPNHSKAEAREKLKQNIAASRGNTVRLHYDPMEQCVLDAADELGVLLLVQSPLLYTIYNETRRSFWNEARDQWLRYVRHSRHHPSVIVWAVANEGTFNDYGISTPWAPSRRFLMELAHKTRHVDPTRPVTSSHDYTLGGASDFFDALHAWGFETDPAFPLSARQWKCFLYWTYYHYDADRRYRRDRPWSNDEWAEGFNLHMGGVLFGDQAYVHVDGATRGDVRSYWARLAQSTSTYMGLLEQRRQPYFCSIMPFGDRFSFWSLADGAATYDAQMVELANRAMADVAVAPLEWNGGAWAGEPYTRTFEAMNDRFIPFQGRVAWAVLDEQTNVLSAGETPMVLAETEHRRWTLACTLPPAAAPTTWQLELRLLDREGTEHYRDRLPLGVIPRAGLLTPTNVVIWPRVGTLTNVVALPALSSARAVRELPDRATLVVVPRRSRPSGNQWRALERFVADGGRALILEDESLPSLFGGVPLRSANRAMVMAHKKTPAHPAVQDIPEPALRYWIGAAGRFYSPPVRQHVPNFAVAQRPLWRPDGGNVLTILEAGLAGIPRLERHPGLTLAPLLEIRHGQGRALVCTLLIAEGLAQDEPGAAALLGRSLSYLADAARHLGGPPRPAVVIGKVWQALGATNATNGQTAACWLVDAAAPQGARFLAEPANWLPYAREGGTVLLHRLSEAQVRDLAAAIGMDLKPLPLGSADGQSPYPTRLDWLGDHPLRQGLGHFETDWIDTGWLCVVKDRHPIARLGVSGPANSVQPLTSHGALTVVPVGKGRLIVDQVCWDDPIRNAYIRRRAGEYAVQLLSNLGVELQPPSGPAEIARRCVAYWRGITERIRRMKR